MAKKRDWTPREMRMVAEYLAKNYGEYEYRMRVRLGSIPTELVRPGMDLIEKRMAGLWRRWADAVVFTPDEVVIVEAAIKPDPGDIGKLQLYGKLIRHTPELEPLLRPPVALELVYALEDPIVLELAREANIRVRYYRPKWLDEYLEILYHRERRAPLGNIEDLK